MSGRRHGSWVLMGLLGASLYAALYLLIASQQFTRYAWPAGMDLTVAGIVPRDLLWILVKALWPVIVTANLILLSFHVVMGFALGSLAALFWDDLAHATGRHLGGRFRSLLAAGSLLGVAALAFATVAVRYPYQYDHLLNAQGGWPRRMQSLLTASVHPAALEAAMWAAILLLAVPGVRRIVARSVGLLAIAGFAIFGIQAREPTSPSGGPNTGPNVVLIFLESARADHLSINGHPQATTPSIDRLVRERGVTFTRAWAHGNGTVESVVTVLTSAYPHTHGLRSMFHSDDFARPGVATLPTLLGERGWATRVATDWDGDVTYFNPRALPGFAQYDVTEFQVVNYIKQIYAQYFLFFALTDNALGHRLFSTFYHAGGGFTPAGSDQHYRTRIARHLAELTATPRFFLTLFFSNAHMNYRCPHPYYARFADPGYEGPNKYQAVSNPRHGNPAGLEREARQIRALYAGCMRAMDDNIGFVADALHRLGLDDRTILVVTGDHGDRLPDERAFLYGRAGEWLDPAEFHVPLVIVDPRPGRSMRRAVSAAVRHVDVMPTVLDLVEVPVPPGLAGVSLVPLMTGAAGDPALDVFGEAGFHWTPVHGRWLGYPPMTEVVELRLDARGALLPRYFLRPDCLTRITLAQQRFVRTDRWQLNYRPREDGGAELEVYDWTVDPRGERDLAATRPEVTADLRARLFRWALGDQDLTVRNGVLAPRDPAAASICARRG